MRVSYNLKNQVVKTIYFTNLKVLLGYLLIFFIVCTFIILIILLYMTNKIVKISEKNESIILEDYIQTTTNSFTEINNLTETTYKYPEIKLSILGQILFQNLSYPEKRFKTFKILIWKEGPSLERRHYYYFTNKRHEPFETCSVNNCVVTYESEDLEKADAVIFLLQKFEGFEYLPDTSYVRSPSQRWVFLTDQSPFNTFRLKNINDWRNYSNIFNWSMSYKMESDIPVPYGRTIPLLYDKSNENLENLIPYFPEKQRDILIAIKTAECGINKKRVHYMEELQKFIDIDIFGKCANDPEKKCPGISPTGCSQLNTYWFYLSFENSNCDQYITDKIFWFAYAKGSIPIIMGPTIENCDRLLPPNSFIHVKDFVEPADLANYLLNLNITFQENLLKYHEWRKYYMVVNEHGYYGTPSYHYCRICEALNFNDEEMKTYNTLSHYLSIEENCKD